MFKKRPRKSTPSDRAQAHSQSPAKSEPAYWQNRLFKNTFTYKGRRVEVSGWSVKIQLAGRRKTFSLSSGNRAKAAVEACQIYQAIVSHGWRAARRPGIGGSTGAAALTANKAPLEESRAASWKHRLIHRLHAGKPDLPASREFSVRLEHAGHSQYFPLGTDNEIDAARKARQIHRTIVEQGWPVVVEKFSRELTVAFRWLDNPLAWTYATIHTRQKSDPAAPQAAQARELNVAVIEPDAGMRRALEWCINNQPGFHCAAAFESADEALREIPSGSLHFVLANQDLPHQSGANCLEKLRRAKPDLAGLLYSVYEDSEHLFHHTPGGASGYMLKRTPPVHLLEPIAGLTSPLKPEQIRARVRDYFQGLFTSMTFGPSALEMAKLTPREHEILALLSKGQLAKEIAGSLGISIWTVQGHIKNIFEKLNVHTRTEAVVKFLQK